MFGAHSSGRNDVRKEQLLRLYWNRASVKRELRSLRDEQHELLDRLKEQEDAIARAREQLDGLERLLINPIAAANAMVYFQLRNVWRVASQRLEQSANELEHQRLHRERKALQDSALSKRQRRLSALEENARTLRTEHAAVIDKLKKLESKLGEMSALLRLFKGRRVQAEIDELLTQDATMSKQLSELEELGEKIEGEPLPELDGLSVEGRRIVNTAIIALAQHLVMHFSDNNLALTSREAMHKTVGEMRFGDRRECDRMVEMIRSRIADLKADTCLSEIVRNRAAMIARDFEYRNASDTVPSVFAVQTIGPAPGQSQNARRSSDSPMKVNVLAEDYWDLSRFLR